jgi:NAD(P)-dependent dehydrogenase (short-subunit alcohol dehydrogenase family)
MNALTHLGLQDKVVLVTGSSKALGAETARRFAATGQKWSLAGAIRFAHLSNDQLAQRVRSASCITHAHPRSQLACEFLAYAVRYLLEGDTPTGRLIVGAGRVVALEEPEMEAVRRVRSGRRSA